MDFDNAGTEATNPKEKWMFKVTKRFPDGLEIEEVTSVEFKVGFVCKPWFGSPSGYEVVKVEKVLKEAA